MDSGQIIAAIDRCIIKKIDEDVKLSPKEVLISNKYVPLHFLDILDMRQHNFAQDKIYGLCGFGTVRDLGEEVYDLSAGNRVGYIMERGSLSSHCIKERMNIFKIPDDLDFKEAALMVGSGVFAQILMSRVFKLRRGMRVLLNRPCNAISHLILQWCRRIDCLAICIVRNVQEERTVKLLNTNAKISHQDTFRDGPTSEQDLVDVVVDEVCTSASISQIHRLKKFGTYLLQGIPEENLCIHSSQLLKSSSVFVGFPDIRDYLSNRLGLSLSLIEIYELLRQRLIIPIGVNTFTSSQVPQAVQALLGNEHIGTVMFEFNL